MASRAGKSSKSDKDRDETLVEFIDVEKVYGDFQAVRRLHLTIGRGEFLTFLGPSGSGKTTTLNMLAGFERPSKGEITLAGKSVDRLPPYERNIGMVFQNYALFPHMSVEQNVAFPLSVRKTARAEIAPRVTRALEMVRLLQFKDRKPAQLSGGQQQRVALARALVFEPTLVLMDEPLGALDKKLREHMQIELKQIHEMLGVTMICVTHDQSEALTMSDRVAVFDQGSVVQIGTPHGLYNEPETEFVASFIGENNALDGVAERVGDGRCLVTLPTGLKATALAIGDITPGAPVHLTVRPERIGLSNADGQSDNRFQATVDDRIYHGDHQRLLARLANGQVLTVKIGEPVLDQTIGEALREAASRYGSSTALIDGTLEQGRRQWSFNDLLEAAERAAHALLTRFAPGERVAIWAANSPEWVVLEFGTALAGVTLVTVNPAYLGNEAAHVLGQSQASGVFVQPIYRGRDLVQVIESVRPDLPHLRQVISLGDWDAFIASAEPMTPLPQVRPGDTAQIQYTSGTTGFPKGAQLTHRGLANNARLYARVIGAGPRDVWVNPMPMFHTAGCGLVTMGALQTGGVHVLPRAFDPALMLALFEAERGTVMLSVPTMLIRMLDHPDAATRDLSSWRLTTLGGAPVPPELVRRAQGTLRLKVGIGFGQTEASPYITHTLPDDPHPDWMATVGRPLAGTEVKVVDPVTDETLPVDSIGEICTRGVGVMTAYFDDERATAAVIDKDGWLHTGDLGSMDASGYCRIPGRLKDMIIRGGENIYPREIEDILYTHPGVAGVAVTGVQDSEWGETVAAFVQQRPGHSLTGAELDAFCRQHLASYKVPRIWRFVDQFPQTASGKIQKFLLREQLSPG